MSSTSDLGKALLKKAQARLKHQWRELEQVGRDDIEAALKDYGDLLLRGAAGEDVAQPMAEVEATIANWSWIGQAFAKRVVLETLHEAATLIGDFAAAAGKRLLGML